MASAPGMTANREHKHLSKLDWHSKAPLTGNALACLYAGAYLMLDGALENAVSRMPANNPRHPATSGFVIWGQIELT